MNICDRIINAVGDILPTYFNTPEFAGDEPEKYAVCSLTERGVDYAEGENRVNQYLVSLNVFSAAWDFALYEQIKAAMYAGGFGYVDGGSLGNDTLYPYVSQYYLDFEGDEERG